MCYGSLPALDQYHSRSRRLTRITSPASRPRTMAVVCAWEQVCVGEGERWVGREEKRGGERGGGEEIGYVSLRKGLAGV